MDNVPVDVCEPENVTELLRDSSSVDDVDIESVDDSDME